MNCPNCGAELPEGSTWCAACGNAIDAPSQGGASDALFSSTPTPTASAPAKKSAAGPIIAVVVILAVIAVAAVLLVPKLKYNGTYELSEISAFGLKFTAEEFEEQAGQKIDMSLKVSFGKVELSADMADMGVEGNGVAKIKFDGDKVIITENDGSSTLEGKYNSSEKTITLTAEGVDMVFKKK
ncbi:MAG: zinc ribbon domain-containing protein [Clostridium sp.]|nr:zinc ribbon domain-containing protein [Clostridium sp.]MCM1460098.1 zinc ribbon domain-containing protein [Bacteroides sp.]